MEYEPKSENEFKKQLSYLYHRVNKEIYGYGADALRVHYVDNLIVFRTKDKRVRILQILEQKHRELKASVDRALFDLFNARLKEGLETEAGLKAEAVFRDYDAASQTAVTVVSLAKPVSNFII